VLPPLTCRLRCQDFGPFFTTTRCAPVVSCNVVGVFPTNAPSISISAAAVEHVIETVAEAPLAATAEGNVGRAGAIEALATGAAEPRVWFASVYTSKATPRLMLTS